MKTIIILSIVILIVFRVFYIIIRDYKKNKNFCSTDCGSCKSGCSSKVNSEIKEKK
jgi:hypothetical protein